MWKPIRQGLKVEIRNESTNELIATVGDEKDPRLIKKLSDAALLSQAPEMLEVLLDITELFKREFIAEQHPLAELALSKIKKITEKSFTNNGRKYAEQPITHQNRDLGEFLNSKRTQEQNAIHEQTTFGGIFPETWGDDRADRECCN